MRHLRPFAALLGIAAITVACSSSAGESAGDGGGESAAAASQPAASTGGGGGGGGTGDYGSLSYEISGDVTKSGDLAFTYINGGISQFIDSGWVGFFYSEDEQVVVQINSQSGTNIVNYGDGEITIIGTEETGCSFDYSQNDSSGLKGTVDCQDVLAVNASGTQIHVDFHAEVDAHT
jgi:hypothetical protein